jgi:hypothetical protein
VVGRPKRQQWRRGVIGFNKTDSHRSGRGRAAVGLQQLVTSVGSTLDSVRAVASPYKVHEGLLVFNRRA